MLLPIQIINFPNNNPKPSILKEFGQMFNEMTKRDILTTNSGFYEMANLARLYKRFGKKLNQYEK